MQSSPFQMFINFQYIYTFSFLKTRTLMHFGPHWISFRFWKLGLIRGCISAFPPLMVSWFDMERYGCNYFDDEGVWDRESKGERKRELDFVEIRAYFTRVGESARQWTKAHNSEREGTRAHDSEREGTRANERGRERTTANERGRERTTLNERGRERTTMNGRGRERTTTNEMGRECTTVNERGQERTGVVESILGLTRARFWNLVSSLSHLLVKIPLGLVVQWWCCIAVAGFYDSRGFLKDWKLTFYGSSMTPETIHKRQRYGTVKRAGFADVVTVVSWLGNTSNVNRMCIYDISSI